MGGSSGGSGVSFSLHRSKFLLSVTAALLRSYRRARYHTETLASIYALIAPPALNLIARSVRQRLVRSTPARVPAAVRSGTVRTALNRCS